MSRKILRCDDKQSGFTLIELSIVLVIIGLIVGGVLVGQDLIAAAAVRAQVAQIEKYNTAVNAFRGKYGDQLPGDIGAASASMFGLTARGLYNPPSVSGDGDGNGVIEGCGGYGSFAASCETMLFWSDLSVAGLIDFQFPSNYNDATYPSCSVSTCISAYLPPAKIGNNNYIYVWSGGFGSTYAQRGGYNSGSGGVSNNSGFPPSNGINYFTLSQISRLNEAATGKVGISANQAYAIDKKADDGFPQSGAITAMYVEGSLATNIFWASGVSTGGTNLLNPVATPPTQYTCFDDANSLNNPMQYSVGTSGGTNINCALTFQFQ